MRARRDPSSQPVHARIPDQECALAATDRAARLERAEALGWIRRKIERGEAGTQPAHLHTGVAVFH